MSANNDMLVGLRRSAEQAGCRARANPVLQQFGPGSWEDVAPLLLAADGNCNPVFPEPRIDTILTPT